ncbi:MAG: hypothetical protein NDJ90_08670 [Oligoflexia bacterium]|nr:hypothetical protein [Oligoflexia bacterium]
MANDRSSTVVLVLSLLGLIGLVCFIPERAFSAPGIDRAAALFQLENRAAVTRVQGRLSCDLGNRNDGQACQLWLEDTAGRQRYLLTGRFAPAMALFHSGTRDVVIEGTFSDASTLEVSRAESL